MKTKEYYWGGNTYVCRIVQANDGEELIIAPTALLDIIQPGSFGDEMIPISKQIINNKQKRAAQRVARFLRL